MMTKKTRKVHAAVMSPGYTVATVVDATTKASFFVIIVVFYPVVLKERNTYASFFYFSKRARGSTLGAESLPGVGQPDPAGHLSARVSDRSLSFCGRDLGPECTFLHGASAACTIAVASSGRATGAIAWENENLGLPAFCAGLYSDGSTLSWRECSAARCAAPGQCDDIVWPESVPDLSDTAGDESQYKPMTGIRQRTGLDKERR